MTHSLLATLSEARIFEQVSRCSSIDWPASRAAASGRGLIGRLADHLAAGLVQEVHRQIADSLAVIHQLAAGPSA